MNATKKKNTTGWLTTTANALLRLLYTVEVRAGEDVRCHPHSILFFILPDTSNIPKDTIHVKMNFFYENRHNPILRVIFYFTLFNLSCDKTEDSNTDLSDNVNFFESLIISQ